MTPRDLFNQQVDALPDFLEDELPKRVMVKRPDGRGMIGMGQSGRWMFEVVQRLVEVDEWMLAHLLVLPDVTVRRRLRKFRLAGLMKRSWNGRKWLWSIAR
jgi:hypothetical protein